MFAFFLLLTCVSALPSTKPPSDDLGKTELHYDSDGLENKQTMRPSIGQRRPVGIIGGNVTTIEVYPFAANVLYSNDLVIYGHFCGGTVLNQRSILTAGHCIMLLDVTPAQLRIRVGSTFASSGGVVHNVTSTIVHPKYNGAIYDSDIAILRSGSTIIYNNVVRPGTIASDRYNPGDNEQVWAIGWGDTSDESDPEQLRHVQIWIINQSVCKERYDDTGYTITDNMLCIGWRDVGGRDQCYGDSGGPLIHNGTVVGVCSWGKGCGNPKYPGVNTRVSRFTDWIINNE